MNKANRVLLLIRFGYEGHRFHGVPRQPGLPTVAEAMKARLKDATDLPPKALVFSARTDTGVSALSNVATCWYPGPMNVTHICERLAVHRDDGLFGLQVTQAPYTVHARGISAGKRYRYTLETGHDEDDRTNPVVWELYPKIDHSQLHQAAEALMGTHDYSSFRASGCTASSTVKNVWHIGIAGPFPTGRSTERWFIEFEGDAFLRKMIRILVGTMVEVGTGWRAVTDIPKILAARDRRRAGITAPARGLCLSQVGSKYPEDDSERIFAPHEGETPLSNPT